MMNTPLGDAFKTLMVLIVGMVLFNIVTKKGSTTGVGSGFFISDDGLFVTAAHVVAGASEIRVVAPGSQHKAEVLFADSSLDFAVLRVQGDHRSKGLHVVSSNRTRTGDAVFTIGFPQVLKQGFEAKFTEGSISSLSGHDGNRDLFQISVPVQPGNSGGPLMDASGNVVGIIVSRLAGKDARSIPQNVNYALKSSSFLMHLESLPGGAYRPQPSVKLDRRRAIDVTRGAVGIVVCKK